MNHQTKLENVILTSSRDITDKQDLRRVYDEIKVTLPPIAGVANAAMVLNDAPFSEMSLEMMETALKPKIDGTNYLDELFYDTDLDFFVLFSSLSSVVGNSGQSNYAAAGAYLTAMAACRRQRGLAASAFDISRVVGLGYVEREGQVVHDQLTKYGYMPVSESDLHQMFAETIRAGRPNTGLPPVVTTGIRAVRDDEDIKAPWFDNPRFSHLIIEADGAEFKGDGQKAALPCKVQLKTAANQEGALKTLKGKNIQRCLEILVESYLTSSQIVSPPNSKRFCNFLPNK
jgi:hybrid polyketide synthase/nonribosomal peptide synthetase ACE1